jgi:hypothetical protein
MNWSTLSQNEAHWGRDLELVFRVQLVAGNAVAASLALPVRVARLHVNIPTLIDPGEGRCPSGKANPQIFQAETRP